VDPDGEVIVTDSGSYAGVTITKAVKVNVASGVVAFSALPIVVNPGADKAVVLRGLTIKAATLLTGSGIQHQSGRLHVENTVVDGWSIGLESLAAAQKLFVQESVFRNNNFGLNFAPGSTASLAVDQSFFQGNNSSGMLIVGGTGRVSNTVMSGSDRGAELQNAGTEVTFQRCEASSNAQVGLIVFTGGVLRVSESTVTRNGTGLHNSGGTLESFGNNAVRGNTSATFGTITPVGLQ
jgi:hypothetical protein